MMRLLFAGLVAFVAGVLVAGATMPSGAATIIVGLLAGGLIGAVAARLLAGPVTTLESPRSELEGWREVSRELERSRRHERPFSMLRVPAPPDVADSAAAWCTDTAGRIERTLRQVDTVWTASDAVWVLMPECGRSQATQTLARIVRSVPDQSLAGASSLVSFPDDAITSVALRRALESPAPLSGETVAPPVASAGSDGG